MNIGMWIALILLSLGFLSFVITQSYLFRSLGVCYISFGIIGFFWSWAVHVL